MDVSMIVAIANAASATHRSGDRIFLTWLFMHGISPAELWAQHCLGRIQLSRADAGDTDDPRILVASRLKVPGRPDGEFHLLRPYPARAPSPESNGVTNGKAEAVT